MTHTIALTLGSLPLSALVLRDNRDDAPLLLLLYIGVAAAILARLSLPWIDWLPDPSAF